MVGVEVVLSGAFEEGGDEGGDNGEVVEVEIGVGRVVDAVVEVDDAIGAGGSHDGGGHGRA